MLLVGQQEGHLACKKTEWWGAGMVVSGARCRLAYGPADATATHCLFTSVKSRLVLPFSCVWVVREKGPLNSCVCVCEQLYLGLLHDYHSSILGIVELCDYARA